MSFTFGNAELLHSNLGGLGPDSSSAQSIRYINVGSVYHPTRGALNLDLELSNRSAYHPADASLNTIINGQFARVNLACNEAVDLRISILQSCTSGSSCASCADPALSPAARIRCYAAGCDCFGTTVYNEASCSGAAREAAKASYGCEQANRTLVLPPSALVSLAIFDFDSGANCHSVEQFSFSTAYEYAVTPLRPSSGNAVTETEEKAAAA